MVQLMVFLFFITQSGFASPPLGHSSPQASGDSEAEIENRTKSLIGAIYSELGQSVKASSLYPGKRYSVGRNHLHLFCIGASKRGKPTLILEAGVGSHSTEWLLVQRELSKWARVCAYDRAGYAWSDEGSSLKKSKSVQQVLPRTIDQNVKTLNRLLTQARISGPLILVGASYGGPLSLAFEARYPKQVRGLVLVDPHEDGVALKDDLYQDAISASLQELEKEKSPQGKAEKSEKLAEIAQHLSGHREGKVQSQVLVEDLSLLVNSLHPTKWLRSMFSEWRALHSSCAKVKAHPSKTLRQKVLTVITSDPTHKTSEGRFSLHRKLAKQSVRSKFLVATAAGHDVASDRPDLIVKAVGQMLDRFDGKPDVRLEEEKLPQIKEPIKLFVDAELAEYIQTHLGEKGTHGKLKEFCRQQGLGFADHGEFGYVDPRKTGLGGYFVICEPDEPSLSSD